MTPDATGNPFSVLAARFGGEAQVVDISKNPPVVTRVGNLHFTRSTGNFTLLPDGEILATGGSANFNDLTTAVYQSELYNPATGTSWTLDATAAIPRLYHSATLLLPDGSVLTGGGGAPGPVNELNAEIYFPPYLYLQDGSGNPAPRPQIISAPSTALQLGQNFLMTVGASDQIGKVKLIRVGANTHDFNSEQRLISLPFTQSGTQITATLNASPNLAPSGYYMIFVFNVSGTPAIAKIVSVAPTYPDLVPTSISYDSTSGNFTSVVANQGQVSTPTGIPIGVAYLVDGVKQTWGAVNGPLAAGSSVTIGTQGGVYAIPTGTHTITVVADDANRIVETNKNNNSLSKTITVTGGFQLPDLIPTSISYNSTSGLFTSVVLNQGNGATPTGTPIGVAYLVDGTKCTWGVVNGPLAAGASVTIGTQGGACVIPSGTHTITIVADDNNLITESNKANNTLSQTITVSGGPQLPDLIPTSISYDGASGNFTSVVLNQGNAATPAGVVIGVAYLVDGVKQSWGTVTGPLAAGASVTIPDQGGAFIIPVGTHTITIVADDVNRIVESNKNNNTLTQTITGLSDLIPTSISYDQTSGLFTSVVLNQGNTETFPPATAIGVAYLVDGTKCTWGSVPGPLAAGASVTIGTQGGACVIPLGTHTIKIVADDNNLITESNKANNTLSQTIQVP
jgi:subtilase family serine protease